jgi:hypothetical protein
MECVHRLVMMQIATYCLEYLKPYSKYFLNTRLIRHFSKRNRFKPLILCLLSIHSYGKSVLLFHYQLGNPVL